MSSPVSRGQFMAVSTPYDSRFQQGPPMSAFVSREEELQEAGPFPSYSQLNEPLDGEPRPPFDMRTPTRFSPSTAHTGGLGPGQLHTHAALPVHSQTSSELDYDPHMYPPPTPDSRMYDSNSSAQYQYGMY